MLTSRSAHRTDWFVGFCRHSHEEFPYAERDLWVLARAGHVGYGLTRMALKQLHMVVRGRVQGVYFRASAQREARRLGVCGWVRNRADGALEIVAEGEEAAVRDLHGWAQKGPSAARVDKVDTRWRSYVGEYSDFRILD